MALSTQKRNSRNIIKEGLGRRGGREREEKRKDDRELRGKRRRNLEHGKCGRATWQGKSF